MKYADIQIGHVYAVKVSGRLAPVQILRKTLTKAYGTRASVYAGPREVKKFYGVNIRTGRDIGPFTAAKCRWELEAWINDSGVRKWKQVTA